MVRGEPTLVWKWIHSKTCAVRVQVEAIIADADPSEPCLEPQTVRWLDELQRLANEGKVDELEKHGQVYVRRSA